MGQEDIAQIYLVSPSEVSLGHFPNMLSGVLDVVDVACFRLDLASRDEAEVRRCADVLRVLLHARDIPLVITEHVQLVEPLGLDGVHLDQAGPNLRKLREDLGEDAIIGVHGGTSRHIGLNAGENGADYVCFGPTQASAIGSGDVAETELFKWWSEMIELPVVAEGNLTPEIVSRLAPVTDFFAIGHEVWGHDDPASAMKSLTAALR